WLRFNKGAGLAFRFAHFVIDLTSSPRDLGLFFSAIRSSSESSGCNTAKSFAKRAFDGLDDLQRGAQRGRARIGRAPLSVSHASPPQEEGADRVCGSLRGHFNGTRFGQLGPANRLD